MLPTCLGKGPSRSSKMKTRKDALLSEIHLPKDFTRCRFTQSYLTHRLEPQVLLDEEGTERTKFQLAIILFYFIKFQG